MAGPRARLDTRGMGPGALGGVRLEGIVVDDRGAPAAGARVSVRSGGRDLPAVTTDEAGRFAVDGLAPEAAWIDAQRDGSAS